MGISDSLDDAFPALSRKTGKFTRLPAAFVRLQSEATGDGIQPGSPGSRAICAVTPEKGDGTQPGSPRSRAVCTVTPEKGDGTQPGSPRSRAVCTVTPRGEPLITRPIHISRFRKFLPRAAIFPVCLLPAPGLGTSPRWAGPHAHLPWASVLVEGSLTFRSSGYWGCP